MRGGMHMLICVFQVSTVETNPFLLLPRVTAKIRSDLINCRQKQKNPICGENLGITCRGLTRCAPYGTLHCECKYLTRGWTTGHIKTCVIHSIASIFSSLCFDKPERSSNQNYYSGNPNRVIAFYCLWLNFPIHFFLFAHSFCCRPLSSNAHCRPLGHWSGIPPTVTSIYNVNEIRFSILFLFTIRATFWPTNNYSWLISYCAALETLLGPTRSLWTLLAAPKCPLVLILLVRL